MSKTELKNAVGVYEAIQRVALAKVGVWHRYFTVGEVAKASGRSKPTVLKYIKECIKLDIVILCDPDFHRERSTDLFKYTEVA